MEKYIFSIARFAFRKVGPVCRVRHFSKLYISCSFISLLFVIAHKILAASGLVLLILL